MHRSAALCCGAGKEDERLLQSTLEEEARAKNGITAQDFRVGLCASLR